MDFFEQTVQRLTAQQTRNATDYTQDGKLYCGKCHTPKQTIINIDGEDRVLPIVCKCERERFEAEEQRYKRESLFLETMAKFERYELKVPTKQEYCHPTVLKYISKWDMVKAENIGLLLYGDVGTGKSTSASYVCKVLKDLKIPCLMTNFATLVDKDVPTPSLKKLELVVFDDLGAERQSEFMLERVFAIVDARINSQLPVIFTTNISLKELQNPTDLKYKRLYDRVLSVCTPVLFKGESHRGLQAKEKLERAKKILLGDDE